MDKGNLLYYFPNEADILCQKNKKSPEYKKVRKILNPVLGRVIIDGCWSGIKEVRELHEKYYKRIKVLPICAGLMWIFYVLLAISDLVPENTMLEDIFYSIILILMILALFSFVYIVGTVVRLKIYKNEALEIYMQHYKPRCMEYSADLRDQVAKMGLDMQYNQEVIRGDEDYTEELEDDLDLFENCVCVFCQRRLKRSDIIEFDYDNCSAICSECNKKAIIPDPDNDISYELLSACHNYWFDDMLRK